MHPPLGQEPQFPASLELPAGWVLTDRFTGTNVTVVRFRRHGSARHWVTARGATFADALESGRHRMNMYDANEHA